MGTRPALNVAALCMVSMHTTRNPYGAPRESATVKTAWRGELIKLCKSIFGGFQPEPSNRKTPTRRRFGRQKMTEPNSITESERRLSNWSPPQSFADRERRETDEQCHLTRFAD